MSNDVASNVNCACDLRIFEKNVYLMEKLLSGDIGYTRQNIFLFHNMIETDIE